MSLSYQWESCYQDCPSPADRRTWQCYLWTAAGGRWPSGMTRTAEVTGGRHPSMHRRRQQHPQILGSRHGRCGVSNSPYVCGFTASRQTVSKETAALKCCWVTGQQSEESQEVQEWALLTGRETVIGAPNTAAIRCWWLNDVSTPQWHRISPIKLLQIFIKKPVKHSKCQSKSLKSVICPNSTLSPSPSLMKTRLPATITFFPLLPCL